MAEKRRGLGRGIGALIPQSEQPDRPTDIFFGSGTSRTESNDSDVVSQTSVARDTGNSAGQEADRADRDERGRSDAAPKASKKKSSRAADQPDPAPHDEGLKPVPGIQVAELSISDIAPNPRQPRDVFDEEYLDELAASIAEVGVLQPVVVRPAPAGADRPWELIMGERRLRASGLAGLETIPAIIKQTEDGDLLRDALLENLHRANLNPLEEASAYQQLLDDFGITQEELAKRIARSRPQISNTLRLLKLPPLVQRRVAAGVLSAGHARALLGLDDGAAMERLAQRIVAEGLSVRATEEIVALGEAPVEPQMRRRSAPSSNQAELDSLATRLADRFDTRVKVTMGARRGRITVDFASIEDLERILTSLAPGEQVTEEY